MDPKIIRTAKRPEDGVRNEIKRKLEERGWHVMITHGNAYQEGFPDLYCVHMQHKQRWIEVKLPGVTSSKFTKAQVENFPKIIGCGIGIWVLVSAEESELKKLFLPHNYYQFLAPMATGRRNALPKKSWREIEAEKKKPKSVFDDLTS